MTMRVKYALEINDLYNENREMDNRRDGRI